MEDHLLTSSLLYPGMINFLNINQSVVVMGGDSCSEGHGFKSHHWMDIFHIYLLKKMCCFLKINEKEAGNGH